MKECVKSLHDRIDDYLFESCDDPILNRIDKGKVVYLQQILFEILQGEEQESGSKERCDWRFDSQ